MTYEDLVKNRDKSNKTKSGLTYESLVSNRDKQQKVNNETASVLEANKWWKDNGESFSADLSNRLNKLYSTYNTYATNSKSKYDNADNNRYDAAAPAWAKSSNDVHTSIMGQTRDITSLLNQYGRYMNADSVADIRKSLDSITANTNELTRTASSYSNYYSQFKDENQFNAWKKDKDEINRLQSLSPDELKAEMADAQKVDYGQEVKKLESLMYYDYDFEGKAEWQKEVKEKYGIGEVGNWTDEDKRKAFALAEELRHKATITEAKADGIAYTDASGKNYTYADLYYQASNKSKLELVNKDEEAKKAYANAQKIQNDIDKIAYIQDRDSASKDLAEQYASTLFNEYGIDAKNDFNAVNRLIPLLEEQKRILETRGISSADFDELYEYEKNIANSKALAQQKDAWAEFATQNALTATLSTVMSWGSQALSGVEGISMALGNLISGRNDNYKDLENFDSYRPNDTSDMHFTAYADTVNSAIANKITEDIMATDLPFKDTLAWLASNGYSGVSSAVYSKVLAATCMALFPVGGEAISLAIMASSAASSALKNSLDNGATNGQAVWTAIANGVNEALFEKISLDKFFEMKDGLNFSKAHLGETIKSILAQGFVEGSEEMFTDWGNALADGIINGNMSDYNTSVRTYLANGYSESEARNKATLDFIEQTIASFYGGAIGGAGTTFMQATANTVNDYSTGRNISDNYADYVAGTAVEIGDSSLRNLAQSVQQKIANEESVGNLEKGELFNRTAEAIQQKTQEAYNKALDEAGFKASDKNVTIDTNTGKRADITSIASVKKNGEIVFNTKSGKQITNDELTFSNADRTIYNAISKLAIKNGIELSSADANRLYGAYMKDGVLSATEYARAIDEGVSYGRLGISLENTSQKGFFGQLTPTQQKIIHEIGASMKTEGVTSAYSRIVPDSEIKSMSIYGADSKQDAKAFRRSLNDNQRMQIDSLGKFNDVVTKAKIVLYASGANAEIDADLAEMLGVEADEEGKFIAPNGAKLSNGMIFVDVNAGNASEGLILSTASHEFTHYISQYAHDKFEKLKNFLFNNADSREIKRLVDEKLASDYGKQNGFTYAKAEEEVVAEAMVRMLTSEGVYDRIAELKQTDKGLWQSIVNFFKGMLKKLDNFLSNNKATSQEAELYDSLRTDVQEMLQKLYAEGLVEAGENVEKLRAEGTAESKEISIIRDAGYEYDEETGTILQSPRYSVANDPKVLKAIMKAGNLTEAEAKEFMKADVISSLAVKDTFLEFEGDDKETAIKENSDYPQGTIDLTNICTKRLPLTALFNRLQEALPEDLFTADDFADIRLILMDRSKIVACGLCFVEDRRQHIGRIAASFIEEWNKAVKDKTYLKRINSEGKVKDVSIGKVVANRYKVQGGKFYPTTDTTLKQEDFMSSNKWHELQKTRPDIAAAFEAFNNARGQSAGRLLLDRAEYKREILKWDAKKVKSVNDVGGLRIFSFSDFEVIHLVDLIQIIEDCALKGVKIQGYTKQTAFAKLVSKTGIKLNRSFIPYGATGIQFLNGKKVIAIDTVEGINNTDENFLDESENPNVSNEITGINDEQIHLAMLDEFFHYIIPFHTNKASDINEKLGVGKWKNYKDYQTDRLALSLNDIKLVAKLTKQYKAEGMSDTDAWDKAHATLPKGHDFHASKEAGQVNIYTEVLTDPSVKDAKSFVEKYLEVCASKNFCPRFAQFLDCDKDGNFKYVPGYEKFLVDFKLFDKDGKILPQQNVTANFDTEFINKMISDELAKGKVDDGSTAYSDDLYNDILNFIKVKHGYKGNKTKFNEYQKIVEKQTEKSNSDENGTKGLATSPTGTMHQNRTKAPVFYSQMQREIENSKQEKLGASSVIPFLKGKGVKDDEIKWSGLQEFLEGKKSVTKAELLEFVKNSALELEEITLGKESNLTADDKAQFVNDIKAEVDEDIADYIIKQTYTDGVFDYEWLVSALTDLRADYEITREQSRAISKIGDKYNQKIENSKIKWNDYKTQGGTNYREILFKMPNSDYTNGAMNAHWGRKGILAHARVQDFELPSGEKALLIEEIQSDWHNAGHEKGYASNEHIKVSKAYTKLRESVGERMSSHPQNFKSYAEWFNKTAKDAGIDLKLESQDGRFRLWNMDFLELDTDDYPSFRNELFDFLAEADYEANAEQTNVPDAPFKATYTDFVMKRLLRMASEGDYDYLAWTTGRMQEERWSSEYAEGYRIEYDQDIPKFVNKYTKKWGAKTENIALNEISAEDFDITDGYDLAINTGTVESRDEIEDVDINKDGTVTINHYDSQGVLQHTTLEIPTSTPVNIVHTVKITDAMRDSVLYEGQPMYQTRSTQNEYLKDSDDLLDEDNKFVGFKGANYHWIEESFSRFNTDSELDAFAKKVFKAFNTMQEYNALRNKEYPVNFLPTEQFNKILTGPYSTGVFVTNDTGVNKGFYGINYNIDKMNDLSDQEKAHVLLHEVIHSLTANAIAQAERMADERRFIRDGLYSSKVEDANDRIKAGASLLDVYNSIKGDADFYGLKNAYEMVAELSNPEFREFLKRKSLWGRIVDAIRNILGIKPTAYDAVESALNKILDDIDAIEGKRLKNIKGNKSSSDIRYQKRFASLTEKRIDDLIEDFGASNPDYSQAYIASISPRDFLKLTLDDKYLPKWNEAEGTDKEIYPLDKVKLANNKQTPYLRIENGEVTGHEGRHRMRALMQAGIESVPVVIKESSTKYSKKKLPSMELKSQDFGYGNVNKGALATISNLIPINKVYRDDIIASYGSENADIRYMARNYDYDYLISKEPMELTKVSSVATKDRKSIIASALSNVKKVGSVDKLGNASVFVKDIGENVMVSKQSIIHGLDRRTETQSVSFVKIGEILQNAIKINEMTPRSENIKDTFVLVGASYSDNGFYITSFIVNKFTNKVLDINVVYSANNKKRTAASLPKITDVASATPTVPTITISELLENVKDLFPELLSESVLRQFGYNRRPDGKMSKDILFSLRENNVTPRQILANALESTVQNDVEAKYLNEYKENIEKYNELQEHLNEVRAEIKELSFAKGKRDTERIKALREDATKTANRLSVADGKLLRLQATSPLKGIVEREKAKVLSKMKEEGNKKLDAYKSKVEAKETKRKILKIAKDLRERMTSPSERRFIPVALVNTVVKVIDSIDQANMTQSWKGYQKYIDGRMALLDIKQQYDSLKNSGMSDFETEYDESFSDMIGELADMLAGRRLSELNADEMEDVYTILSDIRSTIIDASKQIGRDEAISNYEVGTNIIETMDRVADNGLNNEVKFSKVLREWMLNPMRAVREMSAYNKGSELIRLFEDLNNGLKKAQKFQMDVTKAFDKLREGENLQTFNDAVEKPIEMTIKYGLGDNPNIYKVKMTKMQAMQLVLTWEREQANPNRKHLQAYGTVIPDASLQAKGKYKEALTKGSRLQRVDFRTIESIKEYLDTEWDKAFMAEARKFFRETAPNAVNSVTVLTKHRPVATEKAYIPYEVDKNYITSESENVKFDATIGGMGILKSVKANAPQALVMRGLNAVIDRQINDVSKIYGLMIPVRNWNKAFNVKQTEDDGGISVKDAIASVWGESGKEMLDQAVADVQSPRRGDVNPILSAVKSGFVTSTLAGNLSVTMKQAASYPTAQAVLSTSSLAKGLARYFGIKDKQSIYAEIDEHTPLHFMRRQGLSTQELGDFNQSKGWQNRLSKRMGNYSPMNWIQAVDVATTAALWEASKADVEERGIKASDENYWSEVTKTYESVIEETQPMYDPLHRAEVTKNKSLQNVVMFQTQPLQNSGILREASMELKDAKKLGNAEDIKKANKKFRKAVTSQLASHFVFTTMTFLAAALTHRVNPWRDDEEELTFESFIKEFGKEYGENIFGALVPVFGSYGIQALEKALGKNNYDVFSDSVVDKLNSTLDAFSKIKNPSWKNYSELVFEVGSYFGIPAKNLERIVEGLVRHTIDLMNGEFLSFENGVDRSTKQDNERLYDALLKENEEAYEMLASAYSHGNKTATAGVQSAIKDHYVKGDIDEETAERMLEYIGNSKSEVYWLIDRWNYRRDNGTDEGYGKYDSFISAVESGANLKATIKTYLDNGVSAQTLASQITSYFKPRYIEMTNRERASIKGYLLNAYEVLGYKRSDKSKDIDAWIK